MEICVVEISIRQRTSPYPRDAILRNVRHARLCAKHALSGRLFPRHPRAAAHVPLRTTLPYMLRTATAPPAHAAYTPPEASTGQMESAEAAMAEEDFKRLEMLTQACPTDFCSKVLRFPTACSHAAMPKVRLRPPLTPLGFSASVLHFAQVSKSSAQNRYPNILPDEWTRVKLKRDAKEGEDAADYINANYVLGGHYIACQVRPSVCKYQILHRAHRIVLAVLEGVTHRRKHHQ